MTWGKSNQLCIYYQRTHSLRFGTPIFISFPNLTSKDQKRLMSNPHTWGLPVTDTWGHLAPKGPWKGFPPQGSCLGALGQDQQHLAGLPAMVEVWISHCPFVHLQFPENTVLSSYSSILGNLLILRTTRTYSSPKTQIKSDSLHRGFPSFSQTVPLSHLYPISQHLACSI